MPGLNTSLDFEGLDLIVDYYANAPEQVIDAADRAGRKAVEILQPAIDAVTNIDTGYLVSNNVVFLRDSFTVMYENITPYAKPVNDRFQFVDRGKENAEAEVGAAYEIEFLSLAENFFSGR